jgi:hypothetical protein
MPASSREIKRKAAKQLSTVSEEENKKIYRYIRTCNYASSLTINELNEILKTKKMPNYPKYVELNQLQEFYALDDEGNRDPNKVPNQCKKDMVDSTASSTDIMAVEYFLKRRLKEEFEKKHYEENNVK